VEYRRRAESKCAVVYVRRGPLEIDEGPVDNNVIATVVMGDTAPACATGGQAAYALSRSRSS
jgi:hypothetical protein